MFPIRRCYHYLIRSVFIVIVFWYMKPKSKNKFIMLSWIVFYYSPILSHLPASIILFRQFNI